MFYEGIKVNSLLEFEYVPEGNSRCTARARGMQIRV